MIINCVPDTFDILGQGLRNGDLIAVCNVIAHLRNSRQQPIQFYLPESCLNGADYIQKFYQHLCATTDFFSDTPGVKTLAWKRVMLWDFRDIIGDCVKITCDSVKQQKLVVFPVYDAQYNQNRNWPQELLMNILEHCETNYPTYEKILCARDDLSNFVDLRSFTMSTDFITNVRHIENAAVYIGGDTGMSHFASVLDPGPRELVFWYNGRGMIHTLPFYSLQGHGEIHKFWHNFEGTVFDEN